MTVHFIGAGPGAADLITLRARDLIAACPVCLYAGSVVAPAVLAHCPPGARLIDTAPLSLDAIEAECLAAHATGQDVARLHSGDLSVWSAMGEQLRRLRARGIPFQDTPDTYYEMLPKRIQGHDEDIPELEKRRILMDGAPTEGQGLLLQIFTQNVIGPIFFEIIQRKGNEGFGEGNFKALFESIELDQIRRGVVTVD